MLQVLRSVEKSEIEMTEASSIGTIGLWCVDRKIQRVGTPRGGGRRQDELPNG